MGIKPGYAPTNDDATDRGLTAKAADHDRVVAEAHALLVDSRMTSQVSMSCQLGLVPRCRCQACVNKRIDTWLEANKP